jgi:hypothetical protein
MVTIVPCPRNRTAGTRVDLPMDALTVVVRNLVCAGLAALWIGSVVWSIADASERLGDARRVRRAVGLVTVLPVLGLALWLLVRPRAPHLRRRLAVRASGV